MWGRKTKEEESTKVNRTVNLTQLLVAPDPDTSTNNWSTREAKRTMEHEIKVWALLHCNSTDERCE